MRFTEIFNVLGNYMPRIRRPSMPNVNAYIPRIEINALEAMGASAAGFLLARLSQRLRHSTPTNQEVFLSLAAMGTLVAFKFAVSAGRTLRRAPAAATTTAPATPATATANSSETNKKKSKKKRI